MTNFAYLGSLILSIVGLAIADRKLKLALFYERKRALKTIGIGLIFFLLWDIFGIKLGIFFNGNSDFELGLFILPEVPIEEVFFLVLLVYFNLILWRSLEKLWPRI